MKVWIVILVVVLASFIYAYLMSSRNHAIDCATVGEQKVCFVRKVWGRDSEQVSLTTSDNVCHKPSKENDYISNSMRGEDVIFAKITDGKLYVYAKCQQADILDPLRRFYF